MIALIHTIGFVLLGGVFVWAGAEHFLKFRTITAQLAERHFPAPSLLLAVGSIVEIVAGLCLAIGVARAYAAMALMAFTVAASVMALNFWRYSGSERQGLRSAFIINIAVLGGLILAATAAMQSTTAKVDVGGVGGTRDELQGSLQIGTGWGGGAG